MTQRSKLCLSASANTCQHITLKASVFCVKFMSRFSTSSVYYLWIRLLKLTVYLCPPSYLHLNQARFNSFWIISVILMSVLFTEENCSNKIKQAVFFQWFSQLSVIILLLQIEMMKKNCKNSYTKPEVFEGIKKHEINILYLVHHAGKGEPAGYWIEPRPWSCPGATCW